MIGSISAGRLVVNQPVKSFLLLCHFKKEQDFPFHTDNSTLIERKRTFRRTSRFEHLLLVFLGQEQGISFVKNIYIHSRGFRLVKRLVLKLVFRLTGLV